MYMCVYVPVHAIIAVLLDNISEQNKDYNPLDNLQRFFVNGDLKTDTIYFTPLHDFHLLHISL